MNALICMCGSQRTAFGGSSVSTVSSSDQTQVVKLVRQEHLPTTQTPYKP